MEYVVQKGDTLYGIGKQFGVSVSALMEKNQLKSSSLQVGQVLIVPVSSDTYVVQKGDTLYSISKKYGIPVSELIEMNQLTNQILSIGQVLQVSGLSNEDNSSNTYVVQKGDTLYSIAKKMGVSVSDLISYNQLSSTSLMVGQVLYLSPINDISVGSSCYGDVYQEPSYITHRVVRGDTLYSLAKKYGISVDTIVRLNNLSNTNLSIGQILKIKEVS
ncbi:MAG: LysM peptidoglycan-binding domain-containing protein [Bacilli bacterium]|nr:LysM peptidoglycan-binding domain-containing protein [Bacilli bacterium]